MESMMTGKPRSVVIGALRALVIPLREHWGDMEAFKEGGLDVLAREGGGVLYDEDKSPAHLEKVYAEVDQLRALHFRAIENNVQLEHLFKELDLAANKMQSPMQQGLLWLASRLQQQANTFLQSDGARAQKKKVLAAVGNRREPLTRALGNTAQLTLNRVERVLSAFIGQVLGTATPEFERTALGGHLLELARASARTPPDSDAGEPGAEEEDQNLAALLGVLTEPVRLAEVNEARIRYARLSDEEKSRRYNQFRRRLLQIIGDVAPHAPQGFEAFCQVIEANMFPYPEPVEFIRSYAQAIFKNASQSTLFTDANTLQSVQQRYDSLAKSRQGNPVVVEIARAFAMRRFKHVDNESKRAFMREVNFREGFGWPATLDDLVRRVK